VRSDAAKINLGEIAAPAGSGLVELRLGEFDLNEFLGFSDSVRRNLRANALAGAEGRRRSCGLLRGWLLLGRLLRFCCADTCSAGGDSREADCRFRQKFTPCFRHGSSGGAFYSTNGRTRYARKKEELFGGNDLKERIASGCNSPARLIKAAPTRVQDLSRPVAGILKNSRCTFVLIEALCI